MKLQKLLSLVIILCMSFTSVAQSTSYTGDAGIVSNYFSEEGKCQEGIEKITESDTERCYHYRCSKKKECYKRNTPEGSVNFQHNNVTLNDNDNRKNYYTQNIITGSELDEENDLVQAVNFCESDCRKRGRLKVSGKKCQKCLNVYQQNTKVDFDITGEITVQCNKCEKGEWEASCRKCPNITESEKEQKEKKRKKKKKENKEEEVCEHTDKECTEKATRETKRRVAMGNDCVDCEIAKINAKRDIKIAKQNKKAIKAQSRTGGFWKALGTLGVATAGVLAPLLVEKERTKQVTACHNSYTNNQASNIRENRLAFESEIAAQERNHLPLSSWEQMQGGDNYAFMCNGGGAGGYAGFSAGGPSGQYGLGGFNPYYGMNGGYNNFAGIGTSLNTGLGNIFNSLSGIVPSISFGGGANIQGGTAWSYGANSYYGSDPYSMNPYGAGAGNNNMYDSGYNYNNQGGGYNNYGGGTGGVGSFSF